MNEFAGISGDRLRSFVERIEKLESEKITLTEDIKEVFSEAKGTGFDVKIMREIIKLRKMDPNDAAEHAELINVYKRALGMQTDMFSQAAE
ncbi:DUF2312 domain-containing protein [uncultured Sneathiella sp.]|uniref:DUF2312 domain-containing protein n=1 Tax=uncultured Sneathiella sp. TaxID=879315 RepID=UPI0030ECF09B